MAGLFDHFFHIVELNSYFSKSFITLISKAQSPPPPQMTTFTRSPLLVSSSIRWCSRFLHPVSPLWLTLSLIFLCQLHLWKIYLCQLSYFKRDHPIPYVLSIVVFFSRWILRMCMIVSIGTSFSSLWSEMRFAKH